MDLSSVACRFGFASIVASLAMGMAAASALPELVSTKETIKSNCLVLLDRRLLPLPVVVCATYNLQSNVMDEPAVLVVLVLLFWIGTFPAL